MTDELSLAPAVFARLNEMADQFQNETVPALSEHIEAVRHLQQTLPFEIHDCLQADIVRLTDEALVLRNTLELC